MRAFKPEDLATVVDIGNRAWRGIYRMFRETYGDELFKIMVPDEKTAKGEQGMRYARVSTGLDDAHAPARRAYERAGFDICHENMTYFAKLSTSSLAKNGISRSGSIEESLHNRLEMPPFAGHLTGSAQDGLGMFGSMLSNDIGQG